MDVAINGSGFFQVEMPDGSMAYTRDGNFSMNADGTMVTQSGLPLADRISIPQDAVGVQISDEGVISARLPGDQGSVDLGQLEMAKFINPSGLSAMGDNLYSQTETSGTPQYGIAGMEGFGSLEQGYLEGSNVEIVTEMVGLIQAQRAYETNSKMVQTAEDMMAMTNSIKR
jgi:flagellar basal-body rod protein FlgG